jgi:hypothetical protein
LQIMKIKRKFFSVLHVLTQLCRAVPFGTSGEKWIHNKIVRSNQAGSFKNHWKLTITVGLNLFHNFYVLYLIKSWNFSATFEQFYDKCCK